MSDHEAEESFGVSLGALLEEIRQVYRQSKRDWIVAYSGGKDSTATLQLIWYALTALPPEERCNRVFIVSNDTLIEDPAMAVRTHVSCDRLNEAAQAEAEALRARYPDAMVPIEQLFSAHVLHPPLKQRFWYLVLGLGFPAPTVKARWCVSRLKLDPANAFIKGHISKSGEVVITLGAREEESTARALSLRKQAVPGQLLKRHSSLTGAWVYTPIEVWRSDDVWIYLLQNENPWGESNRDLAAIYQASSGECPLIVDRKTPSCAGSRMGCWCCSVVTTNRSLENRVDAGEEWLIPLLEFREQLMDTTRPERKHLYRSLEARGSHLIQLNRRGDPSYRCYTLPTRQALLRRLLEVQEQVRRNGPDPELQLISFEELCAIREAWRSERDWEDTLPIIYQEVTERVEAWPDHADDDWMNAGAKAALTGLCRQYQLPDALVFEVLEAVRHFQHAFRREEAAQDDLCDEGEISMQPLFAGDETIAPQRRQACAALLAAIAKLFGRDWRSADERLAEVLEKHGRESEVELPPLFESEKRRTKRAQQPP